MIEVNDSTQKLGEALQNSNSEIENYQDIVPIEINSDNSVDENDSNTKIRTRPIKSNFSIPMMENLGALLTSPNSVNLSQDRFGRASILGTPLFKLGGDRKKIK